MTKKSDLNLFPILSIMFLAGFFGKLGLKTLFKGGAKAGTKVGAKVGSKVTAKAGTSVATKLGSRLGLKAGIGIGAAGLFGLSNVMSGDGPLGAIADLLGLDSVGDTVSLLFWMVVGIIILWIVIKFMGGRK